MKPAAARTLRHSTNVKAGETVDQWPERKCVSFRGGGKASWQGIARGDYPPR
jgi:hypothetical protein